MYILEKIKVPLGRDDEFLSEIAIIRRNLLSFTGKCRFINSFDCG
jgi:hypothetical protein